MVSQTELDRRKIVGINAETVTNVTSTDYPGQWPGEDHSWDLDFFKKTFNVQFHSNDEFDASFSLIGLDASVANAFRRILIAEVPTVAIEDIFVIHNTSIIQDEVLCHRMGLIPFRGSRDGLRWMHWFRKGTDEDPEGSTHNDYNVCILNLQIECTWQPGGQNRAVNGETDPNKLYNNHNVYARDIVYEPTGQQISRFADDPVRAVNPDILVAKLRPEQKINMRMYAMKGIGADHAKFSPVATASYRLLPTIDILKPILGLQAQKFARCFPKGVIELQPVTREEAQRKGSGYEGHEGEMKAVVKDPMRDTVSRECLRHDEFKGKVKLGRVRDHFIFRVESTGQWESDELFLESVKLLKIKAQRMKRGLAALMR
ncbi:putative DNA-directed RNA polymerase I and III subunit Rpc40 [Mytilinidion resinicola]|uniref:DNA-directed RNA polymerases I and III subunit RPAC1 n=1 Tax=Mytilinidion resinicola TaxID=574789 RepID=A0A6A6Y5Z1_9PEZI|nr:putative DNA-directed RNA polymerase I and III subunit Rpc40 [Mytilinidion resinicola]KAF2803207.1 putative DNA-directed RNA polymerase I and III subunit Rpc40 [Mytilinidion resinicola]